MNAEQIRKLMTPKSAAISVRLSPDLLKLLDATVEKDPDYRSRNELIEVLILRYLESKERL